MQSYHSVGANDDDDDRGSSCMSDGAPFRRSRDGDGGHYPCQCSGVMRVNLIINRVNLFQVIEVGSVV